MFAESDKGAIQRLFFCKLYGGIAGNVKLKMLKFKSTFMFLYFYGNSHDPDFEIHQLLRVVIF